MATEPSSLSRVFFFGRGAGIYSPVPYLITFEKYFWACDRAWKTVRVPTCVAIFFQSAAARARPQRECSLAAVGLVRWWGV